MPKWKTTLKRWSYKALRLLLVSLGSRKTLPVMPADKALRYYERKEPVPLDQYFKERPDNVGNDLWKGLKHHGIDGFAQRDYVLHYPHPVVIEPLEGWAITERSEVIGDSVTHGLIAGRPLPQQRFALGRKAERHFTAVLNVQYGWFNYYHVLTNVLGQIAYAFAHGVPQNTPVLVPSRLGELGFFRAMLAESHFLSSLNWIYQKPFEHIGADALYAVCNPETDKRHYRQLVSWLPERLFLPGKFPQKVYVTRQPSRGRYLRNEDEVRKLMEANGYTVVDGDTLSWPHQVQLFAHATHVAGIHGAGLLNVVFRDGKPLHLIEIMPANDIRSHYYMLSRVYGYDYTGVMGSSLENRGFELDLDKLKAALTPGG